MLRWVEYESAEPRSLKTSCINSTLRRSKRKFLKFPFKYKYSKQDLLLEVSSCIDNRSQADFKTKQFESENSEHDIRNVETLLYKAAFSFSDFLRKQNRWIEPTLTMFSSSEENRAKILAKEFLVTQKTLISFCLQIPSFIVENK